MLILVAPLKTCNVLTALQTCRPYMTRLDISGSEKLPKIFHLLFHFQGEVVPESKQEVETVARICDWSSRPENVPPPALIIKRPKRNRLYSRNTDKNDKEMNTNLLKLLLPSLVLTHILMLGLG